MKNTIAESLGAFEVFYCDKVAQGEFSPQEQAQAHKQLVALENAYAITLENYLDIYRQAIRDTLTAIYHALEFTPPQSEDFDYMIDWYKYLSATIR